MTSSTRAELLPFNLHFFLSRRPPSVFFLALAEKKLCILFRYRVNNEKFVPCHCFVTSLS